MTVTVVGLAPVAGPAACPGNDYKDAAGTCGWASIPERVRDPLSSPFQTQSSYFSLKLIHPLNTEEDLSNAPPQRSENVPKTMQNEGRVRWVRI